MPPRSEAQQLGRTFQGDLGHTHGFGNILSHCVLMSICRAGIEESEDRQCRYRAVCDGTIHRQGGMWMGQCDRREAWIAS